MSLEDAVFVKRTKLRTTILERMKDKAINPSTIQKELNTHLSTVSRGFSALTKRGLIVCINPKSLNYRLFKLTMRGKKALAKSSRL